MNDATDEEPEGGETEPEDGPEPEAPDHKAADRRLTGWLSVGFIIAIALAMIVGIFMSLIRGPQGPWRGEYFENQEFEGEATIRYARKIEFDYKKKAPFNGMPADHWSVIWTTCLDVDETSEFRFRVSSDDGTRVYVDDDLIVDNWGAHATRTRTGKVELEPGVHHLRVDYFEDRHGANVKVLAAIDDGDAESIPPMMLSQPSGGDDPCG